MLLRCFARDPWHASCGSIPSWGDVGEWFSACHADDSAGDVECRKGEGVSCDTGCLRCPILTPSATSTLLFFAVPSRVLKTERILKRGRHGLRDQGWNMGLAQHTRTPSNSVHKLHPIDGVTRFDADSQPLNYTANPLQNSSKQPLRTPFRLRHSTEFATGFAKNSVQPKTPKRLSPL